MAKKGFLRNFREAHPAFCEIVRFLIVGGIATVVDMLVMGVVLYAFQPSLYPAFYNVFYGGGEPKTVATVVGTGCGFVAGLLVNYILAVLFVFDHKGKSKSVGGFLLFTLLSAVGLGIHLLGMYLGYTVFGINEWIVKAVLTLVVLVYNYVSKRLLLFKKEKHADEPAAQPLTAPEELAAARVASGLPVNRTVKISIVVPCYNEEACIDTYYAAMQTVRAQLACDFEYVFVDDGSRDATLSIIRALSDRDQSVRYVSFSRNFGKEAALLAGLQAATGDLVGVMDVDLQDPPEMLLEMYRGIMDEGYDCVSCRRSDRKGESKVRSWFARLFYRLMNRMSDTDMMDGSRDFRLMTRKMTDAVLSLSERERFSKGIFGWVGFRTKWLEYKNTERVAGSTKWNFAKLTKYAIGGIEDFSTAPLKFNFVMSALSLLGFLFFLVFDIVWGCTHHAVGPVLLMMPILLFMAAMLFAGIGLVGEYVRKIFYEVKDRPSYLVRETDRDWKERALDAHARDEKTTEEEHGRNEGE